MIINYNCNEDKLKSNHCHQSKPDDYYYYLIKYILKIQKNTFTSWLKANECVYLITVYLAFFCLP